MSRIAYTVSASFDDESVRDEFIAWLEDGHVDAVIKGGAHSATIVKYDPEEPGNPFAAEARYVFSTREMFDRYVEHYAPALREEGLQRFGPERGVRFCRSIGEIV